MYVCMYVCFLYVFMTCMHVCTWFKFCGLVQLCATAEKVLTCMHVCTFMFAQAYSHFGYGLVAMMSLWKSEGVHTNMHAYTYTCIYMYRHILTLARDWRQLCLYGSLSDGAHTYIHACTCIYMYTHTHTHTFSP
jgi:hypothetical protein